MASGEENLYRDEDAVRVGGSNHSHATQDLQVSLRLASDNDQCSSSCEI